MRFNKKGNIMVFLTSILMSMVMLSMVFVQAARDVCGASYSDAVLEVAGRSVLAEFDRRLKDEYGVFAFHGLENTVESKIRFYADASFTKSLPGEVPVLINVLHRNKFVMDVLRLKLQRVNVRLAEYSLIDIDMFEEQILDYMDYQIFERGTEFFMDWWSGKTVNKFNPKGEDKKLKNKAEINNLPSHNNTSFGIDFSALLEADTPSLDMLIGLATNKLKVDEYIMSHFQYNIGGGKDKAAFFRNEVEYILFGKLSDKANLDTFKLDFIALRTALNVIAIGLDDDKRAVAKAAVKLAPPASTVVVGLIIGLWAAAEAVNDSLLLLDGKNVDFIKSKDTWALDLNKAVKIRPVREEGELTGYKTEQKKIKKYVSPTSDKGYSYDVYMRLFLFFEKRDTKLLRTMDLIQLNLRGSYYKDFLIKEHYTGFSMSATVSGKKFEYEHKY